MILITGGCGFIGSNLIAGLNEKWLDDILVIDRLGTNDKWKNLAKHRIRGWVHPDELRQLIDRAEQFSIMPKAVVHLGAVTDTQNTDADYVVSQNYGRADAWLTWCLPHNIPFIYASSAAIYGDGSQGFDDSLDKLASYRPLSVYAWSKFLFDQTVKEYLHSPDVKSQVVGLRLFNVYGPNEYHKGKMASVLAQQYPPSADKPFRIFSEVRSIDRDFVYVDDVVDVILWFLKHPKISGIFNVGTGQARSFKAFLKGVSHYINYVSMPPSLIPNYQFFTQADLTNLRKVGYDRPFLSVEEGVTKYVAGFLSQKDRYR